MLKNIKEQIIERPFLNSIIRMALPVWIVSLIFFGNTISIFRLSEWDNHELREVHFNSIPLFIDALKRINLSSIHITNVLYILGFNLIAMLIGSRILRWLKVKPDSITTRLAFAIPIGFGIYSIGVFWIGIAGLLYKSVVYVFLGLLVILSLFEIKPFLKSWREGASSGLNKIDYIFLPLIGLFVFMPLFASFSPVVQQDALVYHVALPKIYLINHGITYVPYNVFSTWPANTEMLFLLGLLISGESLSQLFCFSIGLVFLLTLFSFGKRFFSKTVGYLSVVSYLLIPWFIIIMSQPWVDNNLALYAILGIYAFLIWMEKKRGEWLYLSAICCGFAGAIKFQGLFFVLAFFIGFLLTVKRDAVWRGSLLYCVIAMGFVVLPWYIRSWILTGNPIFPFLYDFFGGKNWNDYSNLCYGNYHAWGCFRGVRSLREFVTMSRRFFYSCRDPQNTFVFFIFVVPGLLSFKTWNKTAKYLFFIAVAQYMFIIIASAQMRFLLPCFALLSIIVAYIITRLWARDVLLKVVIVLSLTVSIFIGLLRTYRINEEPFFTGLGVLNPQECRKTYKIDLVYELCQWTNKNVPKGSKILLWSFKGGYFLDNEYVWLDPVWQGVLDFTKINNAAEFLTAIKELNITHILYYPGGLYGTPEPLPHKQFLKLWHQELVDSGKIKLLKKINDSGIYAVIK